MRNLHPCQLDALESEMQGACLSPADAVRVILQTLGRGQADIRAVQAERPGVAAWRVKRRAGESLDALVARACPEALLLAPIFTGDADETEDTRAVRDVLARCVRIRLEAQ